MKISIPKILTFNGGYVDTAGFLTLQGLFTAHVTGNFVTLAEAIVQGSSGIIAKLLALPVFCLVVVVTRSLSYRLPNQGASALRTMTVIKVVLFIAAAVVAIYFGPFADSDSVEAIATGMLLVAGMAIQNAIHRIHFPKAPPTTLMTGSSTQIMIDLADLKQGNLSTEARAEAKARCVKLGASVIIFAIGCAVAALLYALVGMEVFILPPLLAAVTLLSDGKHSEDTAVSAK